MKDTEANLNEILRNRRPEPPDPPDHLEGEDLYLDCMERLRLKRESPTYEEEMRDAGREHLLPESWEEK